MAVRITIPEDLSRYCDGTNVFDIEADNFDAATAKLTRRFPELRIRLLGSDGQLLSHLIVFVNGETVPTAALARLVIASDDELEIMFLASGG